MVSIHQRHRVSALQKMPSHLLVRTHLKNSAWPGPVLTWPLVKEGPIRRNRPQNVGIMVLAWEMTVDLAKIRKKSRPSPGPPTAGSGPAEAEVAVVTPAARPNGSFDDGSLPVVAPGTPEIDGMTAAPSAQQALKDGATDGDETSSTAGEKLLIFDLGAEKYAIPIHDIAQIIDVPPVTPIPNSPPFLAGIFSLRGKIVSVIDASSRMGGIHSDGEKSKVIVLETGGDQFGLLVDRIDLVVDVDLSSLEPPPEGFKPLAQELVEGVFHHRERAVAFLNLPLFLAFEI